MLSGITQLSESVFGSESPYLCTGPEVDGLLAARSSRVAFENTRIAERRKRPTNARVMMSGQPDCVNHTAPVARCIPSLSTSLAA